MEQKDIRASGWLFAIRNRWYARLVTRTPLGSLLILAVTVIGLWLQAKERNLANAYRLGRNFLTTVAE